MDRRARILSSKVEIFNAAASETMAKFTSPIVLLNYIITEVKQFETTSSGI